MDKGIHEVFKSTFQAKPSTQSLFMWSRWAG